MKDLDGVEKNIHKFKLELAKLKEEMKPHLVRFFKSPLDGHSYVNLFVEARRCSPYLTGHIDAFLYPLLVAIPLAMIYFA